MLCDSKGRPYSEAGFPQEMTPESMTTILNAKRETKTKRDEAFAKADKAEGVEKAKLLIEALKIVPAVAVSSAYGETVDEIAKLDPEDKTGFVKKAEEEKALTELEAGFAELMQEEKTDDAIKRVEAFLAEKKPEGEAKQKTLILKLFGFASKEQFKEAIEIAESIIEIDESTDTAGMVKQIKGQLEKQQ